MSTFYAQGSSDDFLRDRGFDKKWTTIEEPKETWQDVTKGPKKKLSQAEKAEKARKASEKVLKQADAIRYDVNGGELLKMLEKRDKKSERSQTGVPDNKTATATSSKSAKQRSTQLSSQKNSSTCDEPKVVKSVPLKVQKVKSELDNIVACHPDKPDIQLLKLAEMFEEAFGQCKLDFSWNQKLAISQPPSAWEEEPASFVTVGVTELVSRWILEFDAPSLTQFFTFLVETAMPGGGLNGKGGDKPYVGLKALLQVVLQNCSGDGSTVSYHENGLRLGRFVLQAEGRVAAQAVPSLLWMCCQLSKNNVVAALNCWFVHLLPVVEFERCNGGKLAKQTAELLKYLLARLRAAPADASAVVDADMLLRIVKLIHPEASQESSKNKEALAVLRSELSGILQFAMVGRSQSVRSSVVALFLPLLSSDGQGDLQQTSRELLMVFLRHDAEGVTMRELVKHHQGHLNATLLLLRDILRDTVKMPERILLDSMREIEAACASEAALIGVQVSKEDAAEFAKKGKLKKKLEKLAVVTDLSSAAAAIRTKIFRRKLGTFCLSSVVALLLLSLVVAGVTLSDSQCTRMVREQSEAWGSGKQLDYQVMETTLRGCVGRTFQFIIGG
uniref:Uncharacterized protein n=1 Tax=Hanusia phi TaxID=3032 RepID=A0A7S0HE82_9CRYP|mmetsp:Transcript_2216/g.5135  ORF Transcript_2216/g.5135 Transcript_2216/m.5135 type:complete len:615 (+) Transcript_2216:21-1865(+)